MKKMRRWKVGALLLVLALSAGCVEMALLGIGGAAAIGAYKWIEGTMERDYPRPMDPCWYACIAVCKSLNMRLTTEAFGPTDSRIEAMQADGTAVKIQLVARPNQITTIKVRFGMWGDKDQSAYFHRRVIDRLGLPPG